MSSKWEIRGLEPRDGGFILSPHVFCVQNGFASAGFLKQSAKLIARCFNCDDDVDTQLNELAPGGLSWDFMLAVFRGSDVSDVVAVCGLVFGVSPKRHFAYVFDVCTDPSMLRMGIGKELMRSVNHLCCLALKDRVVCSDELWLLLDVDLKTTSDKLAGLKKFYSGCEFIEDTSSIAIRPFENGSHRYFWRITCDPCLKCQMWRKVSGTVDECYFKPNCIQILDCPRTELSKLLSRVEDALCNIKWV
jgi:hypothetical protein